ncbi:hypothetical protein D3C76_1683870 [compost metagenome]
MPYIPGETFLPQAVQRFTDGVARSVVSEHQVRFYKRLAWKQTATNDVGTQLQCDVVSQGQFATHTHYLAIVEQSSVNE